MPPGLALLIDYVHYNRVLIYLTEIWKYYEKHTDIYLHDVTRKNFSNSAVITRPSLSCSEMPKNTQQYFLQHEEIYRIGGNSLIATMSIYTSTYPICDVFRFFL